MNENKRGSLYGWKNIFYFTYLQSLKSKVFKVSTVLMVVLLAAGMLSLNFIVPSVLKSINSNKASFFKPETEIGTDTETENQVTTPPTGDENQNQTADGDSDVPLEPIPSGYVAYIFDETGITPTPDYSYLLALAVRYDCVMLSSLSEYEEKIAQVHDTNDVELVFRISIEKETSYPYDSYYSILISRPSNSKAYNEDAAYMAYQVIETTLREAVLESYGITEEQIKIINRNTVMNTEIAGEGVVNDIKKTINVVFPMLSAVLLFVFVMHYGTMIAQSIASEKCNRVMELLLTSVRPLAVITGKVFAMTLVAITQIAIIAAVCTAFGAVMAPFGMIGNLVGWRDDTLTMQGVDINYIKTGLSETFSEVTAGTFVFTFLIFFLGFLFYSLIGGIAGSTVSRSEDLQQALQPLTFTAIIGYFLAYVPPLSYDATGETNLLTYISWYVPFSSPFALPGALITGQIEYWQAILSILAILFADVIMIIFVSKIYERVIVNTGNSIKFKEIFKILKTEK